MKKLGVALSSGGAKGYAHVGVLKVLEKNKIPISFLAGTSMGAGMAAHYALYKDIEKLENLVLNVRRRDLIGLREISNPKISIFKGKKLENFLKRLFGDAKFEETKIPLTIGATDLEDGSQVILDSGLIRNAVRISMSFPAVLPPVKYEGKYLADGGLAEYSPVSLVKKMGAEKVLSVDLYNLIDKKMKDNHMLTVLERLQHHLLRTLLKYDEKNSDKDVVVIRPDINNMMDSIKFKKAEQYIRLGEIATKEKIAKIKKMLK